MRGREAERAKGAQAAHDILEAADQRDADADARDAAADERENDSDLARMLAPREDHYGDDWPERRNAALDRRSSKADRAASHDDRIHLTEDVDDPAQN